MGRAAGDLVLNRRRRNYDEEDVRIRPGRGSRPRTKVRPKHAGAVEGFVFGVDRGRYQVRVADGDGPVDVVAMSARELARKSVILGDRVGLVGDVSGRPGTLARIVKVGPRHGELRRTADDDDPTERVIVANVDQLVVVSALVDPPPSTGFIDRCIVAGFDADIDVLLCLTKADIGSAAIPEVESYYADLELNLVTCAPDRPLTALADTLRDKVSVFIGHSGVGKSTLVNRLVPGAGRSTGAVSAIGKGRHTSTSAVALALPGGGWIVDTPGVRSFGLAHVSPDSLLLAFGDLAQVATDCPRGCDHTGAGGDCALDTLRDVDGAPPQRLVSYRRLLQSLTG
ncbi:ribosome biogenesis GTPase [Stackebrandtia albiflava]|uniref:Ribosome biogenesis GTPase n=1 Tax=Stackebrandtia albiflava TaxID=406432 RepID=A0A562V553_9ACTN|nr:ribosome small subunit-dependent GTPase A [Stackebrandtia albiflava]TWJ13016.1 ribosome biogenesis GTPase [Stackebrandtia albiflava]